jgi:hypothetical protein
VSVARERGISLVITCQTSGLHSSQPEAEGASWCHISGNPVDADSTFIKMNLLGRVNDGEDAGAECGKRRQRLYGVQ